MIIILDAAAPYAGHLPECDDITYFVTHPCHPPIFNDEADMVAKLDRFGGVAAKQAIVNALVQGPKAIMPKAKKWPKPFGLRSCAPTD